MIFNIVNHDVSQERLLSCERLESEKDKDISHGHLSWGIFRRVLGRWRWYGCSLLVRSAMCWNMLGVLTLYTQVRDIGRNGELGLEQSHGPVAESHRRLHRPANRSVYSSRISGVNAQTVLTPRLGRLLPVRHDRVRDRVDAGVCDVD